jgi:hypothetical protein
MRMAFRNIAASCHGMDGLKQPAESYYVVISKSVPFRRGFFQEPNRRFRLGGPMSQARPVVGSFHRLSCSSQIGMNSRPSA